MRKLTATLCLTIAVLLGSAGGSFALPKCKGDYKPTWDKCTGITILSTGTTPSNTGDHYDGEWKDGKPHGKGVLTGVKRKNLKFVGSFKYGNASGWGTLIDNGSKYVGEFENDKTNGLGKIIFPDGNSYIGEWKNNKFNGMGIYFVSGSMLGGKFKDGKLLSLNDNGKLKKSPLPRCRPSDRWGWRNFAERCSGDAKVIAYKPVTPSNAIEYRPIIVYSGQRKPPKWNGTVYSGELTKYKTPHGYGMVTRKNRQVILGTWKKGKLIIPGSVRDAQNLLQVSEHVTPTKSSLPRCKNSPSTREPSYWGWTDCWGTLTHNFVTKFKHNLTYVGEFKDSAYHGEGTYFETDTGNIYAGNFACGHIAVVTEISPNGAKSITDLTNELPSTCKRDVAFDKQITGLSIKEKEDMKSMSEIYQNYHPLKLCQKSRLISNRELKLIQKQTNKILKGMFFDFTEPKRSKSDFKKLKDSAWDHSILELDKNKTYQMSQFLGLGNENLSRDIRSKLKPMCSVYKGQLDNFENILNMAIREEAKKSGKTRKRDF